MIVSKTNCPNLILKVHSKDHALGISIHICYALLFVEKPLLHLAKLCLLEFLIFSKNTRPNLRIRVQSKAFFYLTLVRISEFFQLCQGVRYGLLNHLTFRPIFVLFSIIQKPRCQFLKKRNNSNGGVISPCKIMFSLMKSPCSDSYIGRGDYFSVFVSGKVSNFDQALSNYFDF